MTEAMMTPQLGDLRERDGIFELLEGTGSEGEVWVPWATEYARSSLLPGTKQGGPEPAMSIADALHAEGWISPAEPFPPKDRLAAAEALLRLSHDYWGCADKIGTNPRGCRVCRYFASDMSGERRRR